MLPDLLDLANICVKYRPMNFVSNFSEHPVFSDIRASSELHHFQTIGACSMSPRTKNILQRMFYFAFDETHGSDDWAAILCAISTFCASFVPMSFACHAPLKVETWPPY